MHALATGIQLILNCRDLHPVAKKVAAVVACLVYMTISSALIVLNQQLMNEDGFRYPMALSGLGMGFSAVASYIACNVSAPAFSFYQHSIRKILTPSWHLFGMQCKWPCIALFQHLAKDMCEL